MDYSFDQVIDRRATPSLKWTRYQGRDVLPMWVADMDFRSPPEVIEALKDLANHGIFGYPVPPDGLVEAVQAHMQQMYGWEVRAEWIIWIPGVVTGLNIACRAIAGPGDQVAVFTPIYPPFLSAPGHWSQEVLGVPLARDSGRYCLDLDRFKKAITPRTKLVLLCNPHNPVGRSFARQELEDFAKICLEAGIVICSDEVHCDLILDQIRHVPIASIDTQVQDQTITLMAPSKTFNIPGLGCAMAIIPNGRLRRRFCDAKAGIVPHVNLFGYQAALAAYRYGEPWRQTLLAYLRSNRDLLMQGISQIKGLAMDHVEATYLAWIDARALGLPDPAAFFEQAGVGLSDGADFDGPGFVRLNFGCPRSILTEAIRRIRLAVQRL
ncbi:MAG: PatB family C-S lyase [Sedimentisphaerales bacterium]|nr:PatB family C-S lyase [Sedimentisphaerales bacterium]